MKHFYILTLVAAILTSCSTPKKGNVTITGNIKGLKKGTIYLQKIKDTMLVSIDSVEIDGNAEFLLTSQIEEPEIHYLYLDKNDGTQYNDRIDFFAEPGEITITTSILDFQNDIKIVGGKNQTQYMEYKRVLKRFNERNLRLIKEDYEASKQKDEEKLMENDEAYKKLIRQKYLYTINFAIFNRKLEVAPYITLHEVYDANLKLLDTVAESLSPRIKKSKYGKQLLQHIEDRKAKDSKLTTNKKE